jgi:AraC-like DNA-binding protein
MTTSRKKKPRTFTLAHRQRLDRAAEHYLRFCYRNKTAARASEFATFVNRSPEYLSWLGRNALGQSVRDFLRRKQVAYAAQLLRTTPLPVTEIAIRAGFGTPGTLYRWFSAVYGVSPGEYRGRKK